MNNDLEQLRHQVEYWKQQRESSAAYERTLRERLQKQLADSQKREVMLRGALTDARVFLHTSQFSAYSAKMADKALAATADLDGLILCHADEVGWIGKGPRDERCEFSESKPANSVMRDFNMKPVYRAWEPK